MTETIIESFYADAINFDSSPSLVALKFFEHNRLNLKLSPFSTVRPL
jgi:hypothetical protein